LSLRDQLRASRAIGAKNYDEAIDLCKRMLEKNSEDYNAISMLAVCYEWKGDIAQAIIYADKFLSRVPNELNMLLMSARYWAQSGDEERTYTCVCRAIESANKKEPEIPRWLFWLMKPLSIFKKFRGLEKKAELDAQSYRDYKKNQLDWAKKYKAWYESKKNN
jgi:tetratricopeptide (TPR) repeat protein